MDIETKISELEQKIDNNMDKIIKNMEKLHSHDKKISENKKQIQKNTGALEILHTINNVKKRFFIMWASTFALLFLSICLNIYLFLR